MFSSILIVPCVCLFACIQANFIPLTPRFNSNTSSATPTDISPQTTSPACCFIVQDTVTEQWWPITSTRSTNSLVNLTSITTFITPYPNGTITSIVTNIYPTNASFLFPIEVGVNPIAEYGNSAPEPAEIENKLNGTAVVTAGVTIQSPAAFYVYSTVKIITAEPVTNTAGQPLCGTISSWSVPNMFGVQATFTNINSNAEAYFGGERTNGVVMSLTTPLIYQPTRGATGQTSRDICYQSDGAENFGYVPQTLLDYMISNRDYVSQYPGLASCLPGGPSIIPVKFCYVAFNETFQTAEGGDLTSSTVVIVTPLGGGMHTPRLPAEPTSQTDNGVLHVESAPPSNPHSLTIISSLPPPPPNSIGGLPPGGPSLITPPPGQPTTITGPTTIPIAAVPAGLEGSTTVIGGSSFVVVPSATTIMPPAAQPLPASLGTITSIGGTPVFVIPSSTTVPAAGLPSGLGSTVTTGGIPFVIIPPTTIPLPASTTGQIFSTTNIAGTPFLLIPGPTSIPVAGAPAGLTGSTILISGTPFFDIPSATSIPALPGHITVIGGTTYDIFSGPTTVPVNPALSLLGKTTVISGTTMVILPGATTVPVNPGGATTPFLQVSVAARGKSSWIGFLMSLAAGFLSRFR